MGLVKALVSSNNSNPRWLSYNFDRVLPQLAGIEVPAPKVREHRSAKQSLVAKLLCLATQRRRKMNQPEVQEHEEVYYIFSSHYEKTKGF